MSVLIEGIGMPKNCINCAARHGAECWLANCSYIPNFRQERPKWCPLVPVPPHGRLIDADKLGIRDAEKQAYEAYLREKGEDFIEEPIIEYHRGYLEGLTHASGLVRFAPTIIPASKEEA